MYWLLPASIAVFLWGLGYVFLKPIYDPEKPLNYVSPFFAQFWFGTCSLVLTSFIFLGALVYQTITNVSVGFLTEYPKTKESWLCITTYGVFCSLAGISFYFAIKLVDGSSSPVVAYCSIYPLITLMVSLLWYYQKEKQSMNLYFVIPGTLLATLGVILVALGKRG